MSERDTFLSPPNPPFGRLDTPSQSSVQSGSPYDSFQELPVNEERAILASPSKKRGNPIFWIACLLGFLIVVAAVMVPVYFTVIKPKQDNTHASAATSSSGTSGGSGSGSSPSSGSGPSSSSPTAAATTGGDGSTVTLADGSTFVYTNQFGGFWVDDPNDPFNNNAQPNSWTPPLNASWTYGTNKIYGVNLGGWLVLEPFITPQLYQKYPGTVDEWTLSEAMANDPAGGGLGQIEDHYNTFITEQDIAEIAGAGLNWVRVPIPFWAIDAWPGEPFLVGTAWKYFLRLVGWCRKYGIRINLDLHTIPGSQNGFNHSGKLGSINFLNGVMGVANAERTLDYIRILTEFISQPQYRDVIPMFSIINEAELKTIGRDQLTSFYLQVHDMMRGITGIGQGPFITIHDGFQSEPTWAGFLTGSDRIALDSHPYFAFNGQDNSEPIAGTGGVWPAQACNAWGPNMRNSQTGFGFTFAGEFSNGFNDCGLFLRGVGGTSITTDCADWTDSSTWTDDTKTGLMAFAEASMDALDSWFFWTWKIGNSSQGIVESPLWSYQLGLQNGWMPTDPRTASGKCSDIGVTLPTFDEQYQPWQTGGAGAGTIVASSTSLFGQFPPTSIADVDVNASLLPTYTQTGIVSTLPPPTFTPAPTPSVDVGNGWLDAQDTQSAYTTKAGCTYPDAWDAVNATVPPLC